MNHFQYRIHSRDNFGFPYPPQYRKIFQCLTCRKITIIPYPLAGKNGFANSSGYCASKAAVIGFTRALAAELGGYDITVNAVCPGSVATPMIEEVIQNISANTGMSKDEARTMMESGIPLKRFQQPEDVAQLVCFLASDAAKNISGESINLDGGVVRD